MTMAIPVEETVFRQELAEAGVDHNSPTLWADMEAVAPDFPGVQRLLDERRLFSLVAIRAMSAFLLGAASKDDLLYLQSIQLIEKGVDGWSYTERGETLKVAMEVSQKGAK